MAAGGFGMLMDRTSRRDLLRTAAVLAASGPLGAPAQEASASSPRPSVCLFSKPLGNRSAAELPAVLAGLGISAVDLTCRAKGHVLPERVADDLPKAHERLKAAGIAIPMLTTEITEVAKGNAEAILRTAAGLGIRFAKLGYYSYRGSDSITRTLAEVKARLRDLAVLCRECGVTAGFHNHSGRYVGAAMWDVWELIRDLPPEAIGSYFDFGHATVEGGDGGWSIGLELLRPRVVMLSIKDMKWEQAGHDWRPQWGPLGAGMVRWKEALALIAKGGFAGPISLHVEYGHYTDRPDSQGDRDTLANIRRDWTFLQDQLRTAGLK